jgi:lipopolysaccharide export system permease protein
MSTTRIQRYILREITVPTVLGLTIFTFVLFMGRILRLVELVINKGVPAGEIGRLFLYLLPAFLVITLPLSVLLGILLGFGRLSADSETIALKSSGISLYGLLKPALLLAALASVLTGLLTLIAEPAGNAGFRNQIFQIAASRANIGIQPRVFNDEFDGLVLYTNDIHDRTGQMQGVFIADERVGATPAIILARNGRILSDADALTLTLRLENGSIHRRPIIKGQDAYQIIDFQQYDLSLNLGQELSTAEQRPRRAKELSLSELRQRQQQTAIPGEQRTLAVEMHRRFVLPAAPLLFALLAVPLGIQFSRSGRGGGFALGLLVFLLYYILFSLAETLAVEGGFSPALTMWLPNALFLGAGIYLLRLAALERRVPFLDRALTLWLRLVRRLTRRKVQS